MNEEDKKIAIRLLIEKSQRHLHQAEQNAELKNWDLVANRLYYSIFHAVTALLLKDNIEVKTHKGRAQQFGKYYVLTGKFSKEDGRLYNNLQKMREEADYNNVFILSETEAMDLIQRTKMLQQRILNPHSSSLIPHPSNPQTFPCFSLKKT